MSWNREPVSIVIPELGLVVATLFIYILVATSSMAIYFLISKAPEQPYIYHYKLCI